MVDRTCYGNNYDNLSLLTTTRLPHSALLAMADSGALAWLCLLPD